MALGQEPFACVSLEEKALPFVAQLVPEGVEFAVVRPMDNVAQLVQHRVDDALRSEELILVLRIA